MDDGWGSAETRVRPLAATPSPATAPATRPCARPPCLPRPRTAVRVATGPPRCECRGAVLVRVAGPVKGAKFAPLAPAVPQDSFGALPVPKLRTRPCIPRVPTRAGHVWAGVGPGRAARRGAVQGHPRLQTPRPAWCPEKHPWRAASACATELKACRQRWGWRQSAARAVPRRRGGFQHWRAPWAVHCRPLSLGRSAAADAREGGCVMAGEHAPGGSTTQTGNRSAEQFVVR